MSERIISLLTDLLNESRYQTDLLTSIENAASGTAQHTFDTAQSLTADKQPAPCTATEDREADVTEASTPRELYEMAKGKLDRADILIQEAKATAKARSAAIENLTRALNEAYRNGIDVSCVIGER